jgi:protein-S-isoprenylcysteine O-methyltransferase Ste14
MAVLLTPVAAIYLVWIVWAVSWIIAAVWASRAAPRPGFGAETGYRVLTVLGFLLIFLTGPTSVSGAVANSRVHVLRIPLPADLVRPLWSVPDAAGWAMVGLAILGMLFAWWARIHLGTLWSGSITRKADHRIVDTGPYGIVRHPIYTGLLTAAIAMVVVKASWAAIAGLMLMTIGYWLKATIEEGFLRKELGPEDYDAYRKRVPMLVPFSPV